MPWPLAVGAKQRASARQTQRARQRSASAGRIMLKATASGVGGCGLGWAGGGGLRYRGRMNKGRLEAFSDGVLAIIITIMVLEMKVPHGADLQSLHPLLPVFLTYAMSF